MALADSRNPGRMSILAGSRSGPLWLRKYPPLLALVTSLLIAVLILPSALNLPQANPTQVQEFAPVPPDIDQPPSSEGSISQLGLGFSNSLTTGAPSSPPPRGGEGEQPVSKSCLGQPPRQTEDPNSPPCVPFFDGDNGGETWQGVNADEITVLIYHTSFISDQNETEGGDTSAGEQTRTGQYCDLARPSTEQPGCRDANTENELSVVAAARALSSYFNDRFQTYKRYLHFYIYWSGAGSPSGRRSDAQALWERLKPFAVLDRATFGGYNEVFAESMAKRRTMVFGSFGYLESSFFRRLAPQVWTFWPDIEHWADLYVTYVCSKVAPFPVSHAGGPDKDGTPMNDQERRFGLMSTSDPFFPGLHRFAELVETGLRQQCDANIVEHVKFPYAGANVDLRCETDCGYGITNVAKLRDAKVTTVLWLGGMEAKTTPAADQAGYYPEWVVAGDRVIDDLLNGRAQNQNVWKHAWVVSNQLKEGRFEESPARMAYRAVEPTGRQIVEYWATTLYRDMFTLAKAVQVAGPYISPETVDQGNHTIPRQSSTSPHIAACFYDPGDFSCVKDAHEAWWDPFAEDPNGETARGCWRMIKGGQRFLAGTWSNVDEVFSRPEDPCNGIKGASYNYL